MNTSPKKKGWFRNQSISTKLSIVLVLTALIPLILLSGYNLYAHAMDLLDRSLEDLERLSISNADLINRLIADTSSALHMLASDPEVIDYLANVPKVSEEGAASGNAATSADLAFQNALDSNPLYEYTYLINTAGDVLISKQLEGLATVQGQNFANRDYFIQGMLGNDYIDVLIGRVSGKMGFYFSTPVRDELGDILGVAIIKLQGDAITGIINQLNSGENNMSAILIDQDGVVVSPPRNYEDWLFHSVTELPPETQERVKARFVRDEIPSLNVPALVRLVGVTDSGSFHTLGSKDPVALGYAPIEQLKWIVGINIPPQVLIDRITDQAKVMLISGFFLSLIAVAIAVFLARSITRPISKLALAAQRVEEDQPFEPEDIADVMDLGDELGHLARVFSAMVLALRARIADLRTIYEISQEISAGVELEETLVYILRSIHNVIPYDVAELGFYQEEEKRMVIRASANYLESGSEDSIAYYEPETARFYDVDEGILARLVKEKGALLITAMQTDQDLEIGAERKWGSNAVRSYLGVALKAKNKVIGSIELVSHQPGKFTEDNSCLLTSIATQAAIEVQNAQEIQVREQRLAQQIQQMDIVIDKDKQAQQVAQITESDFFQLVQDKARNARKSERN